MRIGFLTKYKHLPLFTKFVEENFECIDLSKKITQVDYIFSAPNYNLCTVTDKLVEETKCIGVITPSTGTNHIQTRLVPTYSIKNDKILEEITSTAEHNLYLILRLLRTSHPIHQASDLTLGILGYGRLGKILHNISAKIFKDIKIKDIDYQDDDFFEETDILSINVDYTDSNKEFINKKYINQFKKDLFIVNTSRGELVNENDILELVYDRKIIGYGTDVIQHEFSPLPTPFKIYSDSRIIITPHVGGTAIEAQEKAYKHVITKIL